MCYNFQTDVSEGTVMVRMVDNVGRAQVHSRGFTIKRPGRESVLTAIYEWAEAAAFSLIGIVILFTFFIRIVGVDGDSMNNTLLDGDRLFISHILYEPAHEDIVVINRYTQEPLIKRIIAVGGDRLEIDPEMKRVILNGKVLEEDFINGSTLPIDFIGEQIVPEGFVFVMGDNRSISHDSRTADIGFIDERDIIGKAVFRIWPLSKIGLLH